MIRASDSPLGFQRGGIEGLFEVEGKVSGFGRHGRAGYVGALRRLVAMSLNTVPSGQVDAKAIRRREALSMTRAATLMSRRRSVANSAAASPVPLGNGLLDAPQQPVGGGI